jgi:hypothetical protein
LAEHWSRNRSSIGVRCMSNGWFLCAALLAGMRCAVNEVTLLILLLSPVSYLWIYIAYALLVYRRERRGRNIWIVLQFYYPVCQSATCPHLSRLEELCKWSTSGTSPGVWTLVNGQKHPGCRHQLIMIKSTTDRHGMKSGNPWLATA